MFLENVEINNFKGIEEITLEFTKGFNLLVGDNGYGKTSVLEAISVGLGGFTSGIEDVATKHFSKDEVRMVLENTGEGSYNRRYLTPVSVRCKAVVEDQSYEWIRRKNSLRSSRSTVEPRDICKQSNLMANEEGHILPILSYQSTARLWMQKRESSENIFRSSFHRTVGYEGCLSEASNIKMLMNWVRRMEQLEWKEKRKISEYRAVKRVVCQFMNLMGDEVGETIDYDVRSDDLVWVGVNQILPIGCLSSGYQSLIWMVFEIAYRMAVLNPDLCENVNTTPGVILIDELDMHLHPKWQWNVVKALKTVFPNVQFIAATHSPIILASCKDENLIRIEQNKKISYDKSQYGLEVNDVLSGFQESVSVAPEIESILQDFAMHLDEEEYVQAETDLSRLTEILGENHPQVISAQSTLMLEKMQLEDDLI